MSKTPDLREQLLSLRRRISEQVLSVEHLIQCFRHQKEFAMAILQEAENDIILCADDKLKRLPNKHPGAPNPDKDAIVAGARDLVDEIDMQRALVEAEERSMCMQLMNLKQLQNVAQDAARDCSYKSLHKIHMQLAEQMRSILEDLPTEDILDVKAYRFLPSVRHNDLGCLEEWIVTYEDKYSTKQLAVPSTKEDYPPTDTNILEEKIYTMARTLSTEDGKQRDITLDPTDVFRESDDDDFDIFLDSVALKSKNKNRKSGLSAKTNQKPAKELQRGSTSTASSSSESPLPSPAAKRVPQRLSSLDEFGNKVTTEFTASNTKARENEGGSKPKYSRTDIRLQPAISERETPLVKTQDGSSNILDRQKVVSISGENTNTGETPVFKPETQSNKQAEITVLKSTAHISFDSGNSSDKQKQNTRILSTELPHQQIKIVEHTLKLDVSKATEGNTPMEDIIVKADDEAHLDEATVQMDEHFTAPKYNVTEKSEQKVDMLICAPAAKLEESQSPDTEKMEKVTFAPTETAVQIQEIYHIMDPMVAEVLGTHNTIHDPPEIYAGFISEGSIDTETYEDVEPLTPVTIHTTKFTENDHTSSLEFHLIDITKISPTDENANTISKVKVTTMEVTPIDGTALQLPETTDAKGATSKDIALAVGTVINDNAADTLSGMTHGVKSDEVKTGSTCEITDTILIDVSLHLNSNSGDTSNLLVNKSLDSSPITKASPTASNSVPQLASKEVSTLSNKEMHGEGGEPNYDAILTSNIIKTKPELDIRGLEFQCSDSMADSKEQHKPALIEVTIPDRKECEPVCTTDVFPQETANRHLDESKTTEKTSVAQESTVDGIAPLAALTVVQHTVLHENFEVRSDNKIKNPDTQKVISSITPVVPQMDFKEIEIATPVNDNGSNKLPNASSREKHTTLPDAQTSLHKPDLITETEMQVTNIQTGNTNITDLDSTMTLIDCKVSNIPPGFDTDVSSVEMHRDGAQKNNVVPVAMEKKVESNTKPSTTATFEDIELEIYDEVNTVDHEEIKSDLLLQTLPAVTVVTTHNIHSPDGIKVSELPFNSNLSDTSLPFVTTSQTAEETYIGDEQQLPQPYYDDIDNICKIDKSEREVPLPNTDETESRLSNKLAMSEEILEENVYTEIPANEPQPSSDITVTKIVLDHSIDMPKLSERSQPVSTEDIYIEPIDSTTSDKSVRPNVTAVAPLVDDTNGSTELHTHYHPRKEESKHGQGHMPEPAMPLEGMGETITSKEELLQPNSTVGQGSKKAEDSRPSTNITPVISPLKPKQAPESHFVSTETLQSTNPGSSTLTIDSQDPKSRKKNKKKEKSTKQKKKSSINCFGKRKKKKVPTATLR